VAIQRSITHQHLKPEFTVYGGTLIVFIVSRRARRCGVPQQIHQRQQRLTGFVVPPSALWRVKGQKKC